MASHFEVCSSSLKLLDDEQIQHVGEALGLRYNVLQRMDRCCFLDQMVAAWLRKEDNVRNDPTWRTLIEALRNEGQSGVAETIEEDKR